MSKLTGGPAFPVDRQCAYAQAVATVGTENETRYIEEVNRVSGGMTLRDYFAAKAMQGILANPGQLDNVTDDAAGWVSRDAFKVADAMLKVRES